MSGMTKFILGGLLIVLALLGIKSLLPTDPANAPPSAEGWEQPMLMPNANLPSPDTLTDNSRPDESEKRQAGGRRYQG